LDIEDVSQFTSSTEFEKKYYASLRPKGESISDKNPLADLPPDFLKFLNTTEFAKDRPFLEEETALEITPDKTQILKVNIAKLFGNTIAEIISKNLTLESQISAESLAIFKTFIESLAGGASKPQLIAVKNEKGGVWVLEMVGKKVGANLSIKLIDKTKLIMKALGKSGDAEKSEDVKGPSPIDIIIFRYTNVVGDKNTKAWVTRTAALLQKAKFWPPEGRPKFIAVRHEGDLSEKSEFNHPFIDDLLCLPLDRLIFLQKIEIVLNLPKKTSPSHLFVQETNEEIEIAKKMRLERICDLGFAMSNPFPLTPGTLGHFYFRFPGQKPLLDVHGKVFFSHPHPDRPTEYLVYFTFFGMSKLINRELRQYLARDSAYKNLVDMDPKNFEYNPENIFLTEEQKTKKTVAVLDIDEASQKNMVTNLRKEIGNLDVVFDDTYYGFFKKYLDKSAGLVKSAPSARADFFSDVVSFIISADSLNLQMPLSVPSEGDRILGFEATVLFATGQGWMDLFAGDARNLLTECLHLIHAARRIQKNMDLKTADQSMRAVAVEMILEDNSSAIRFNIRPPEMRVTGNLGQLQKIDSLEAVIIDYSLLPEDPNSLVNGLKLACTEAGIKTLPEGPRVIVTAAEGATVNFELLSKSNIYAFIYKPLEIRRFLFLVAHAVSNPFTVYTFENIGWKHDQISAKIARKAQLTELAEFGAVIRSEQPLKPGTMIYLFRDIYQNAPDQNLCVRVYHSEEDSSEKGTYLNSVIYFGITDTFLKFTRSYIRETYASKKAKEGGGT
jgi:hypothetical protein